MADNYLEKRYAELQQGKPVLRRSTPSLDSLLKKLVSSSPEPGTYEVKCAQLDAVARSASILFPACRFETAESEPASLAHIRILSEDLDDVMIGEIVLTIRLKAAELGLFSRVDNSGRLIELFR